MSPFAYEQMEGIIEVRKKITNFRTEARMKAYFDYYTENKMYPKWPLPRLSALS